MTEAIDDIGSLPGRTVHDQEMRAIGKVEHVYAMGGDGEAAWVGIKASFSLFNKRIVVVPLARLKQENDELVVPYSFDHIRATPEIEGDEIDEADDRRLRDHFSIDAADQELRDDNLGYVTMVPDEPGSASRVEDASSVEMPDPDKRDEGTMERLRDPGPGEAREVDAGEIANELTTNQANSEDSGTEDIGDHGGGQDEGEGQDDTRSGRPTEEPAAAADEKRERSGS